MAEYYPRGTGYLESARLRLVPATVELTHADLAGRLELQAGLQVDVPENWPPDLYDRPSLEWSLEQLKDRSQQGWNSWYLIHRDVDPQLCGICGFKGRPDQGVVEIAYSILSQYRRRGLATEAVERLVQWAFTQPGVTEVCAETLPHLVQSIGVLERNGFKPAGEGSEYGVVRYALKRDSFY